MNSDALKNRTKNYAIAIANIVNSLVSNILNRNYSSQIVRCSSSVGANYSAACRAKSIADFINKLKIVEEELDESMFFLELLAEFNPDHRNVIREIHDEGNELLRIIVSSILTVRKNSIAVNLNSKI